MIRGLYDALVRQMDDKPPVLALRTLSLFDRERQGLALTKGRYFISVLDKHILERTQSVVFIIEITDDFYLLKFCHPLTESEYDRLAALNYAPILRTKHYLTVALSATKPTVAQKFQSTNATTSAKIWTAKKLAATADDIDRIADKRTILGDIPVIQGNWKMVSSLAKEGLKSREIIKRLLDTNASQSQQLAAQKSKLKEYGEGQSITAAMRFHQAEQRAPQRMAEVMADIMRQPPEQQPQNRVITRKKQHEHSR